MLLQAFDGMPRITKPSRRCPSWTTPSPSQRPMEPPRSESREDREKGRKSVVVTLILSENCILITEPRDFQVEAVSSLVSVWVVVQGRGQDEGCVPSTRSR